MDFLNPIYLFLLSAAGLPLLLHLLRRRKIPEVPFSTLRFVKRSDRRSMRKIDLRRLILLILRMAAIACAALAFSRPVITGGLAALFPGGGPKAICILLDRSCSMAMTGTGGELMDRAKVRVVEIAESAGDDDEVTVILFDERTEVLFGGERFSPAVATELTEGVDASWYATSLREAVREGISVLAAGRREERELYIVSDLQRSSLSAAGAADRQPSSTRAPVPDGEGPPFRAFIVPVQAKEGPNVSIDEVLTPRVAIHRGEPARVSVTMRNHSGSIEARFPLRVDLDEKTVIEREITIPPLSARSERFELPVERAGWIRGEVYKNPDRQRRDDRRFFTILSREKVEVLLLGGEADLYLRTALDPGDESGDVTLREKTWGQLTTEDLGRAEVVVIGTGLSPAPEELALVRRYVSQGGKALVFLAEKTARTLSALSLHGPGVMPGRSDRIRTLQDPAEVPGFLGPFGREDLRNLSRITFTGGIDVDGVPGEDVLLSFRSGAPFVWRERHGRGVMMFVATDPDPSGGDLVLSPLFLPLVQQAVLAMDPGEPVAEGLAPGGEMMMEGSPDMEYTVKLADGSEARVLPASSEVTIGGDRESSGPGPAPRPARTVVVPAGDMPGHIEVTGGGQAILVASVNPPAGIESSQLLMTGTEAADSLGLEHYAVLEEGPAVSRGIREAREGREISAQLAVLALALLVVELFVSQRREMAVEEG